MSRHRKPDHVLVGAKQVPWTNMTDKVATSVLKRFLRRQEEIRGWISDFLGDRVPEDPDEFRLYLCDGFVYISNSLSRNIDQHNNLEIYVKSVFLCFISIYLLSNAVRSLTRFLHSTPRIF